MRKRNLSFQAQPAYCNVKRFYADKMGIKGVSKMMATLALAGSAREKIPHHGDHGAHRLATTLFI